MTTYPNIPGTPVPSTTTTTAVPRPLLAHTGAGPATLYLVGLAFCLIIVGAALLTAFGVFRRAR